MKKYLQEVMANPEYRKAFEEDELFATLVTAMTYEPQSEVKIVHSLCKHLKDLCEELEYLKDLCEKLVDAPSKEMLEKRFKEEIHKFKAQYGEPPEVILAGKDIQLLLADYIIVSNRASKPEKTLFGVPLEDGVEGTIAFASGRRRA